MVAMGTPFATVDQLVAALERLDGVPSDDVVAALPHLLQTADLLADTVPDDPELIAAGLVHDVASALGVAGDHARVGAALVRPLLGDRVAALVAGHTDAKRYLVTIDPTYAEGLSENSTYTLVGQGGPMSAVERHAFEVDVEAEALVALRRADDRAKEPGRPTRPPGEWRSLLDQVALRCRPSRLSPLPSQPSSRLSPPARDRP